MTPDDIQTNTGFPLSILPGCPETPPPTPEELAVIRGFDPRGHRLLDFR